MAGRDTGGTRRSSVIGGMIIRMAEHAAAALRGLALGDAFGQTWFRRKEAFKQRELAPAPWKWTDDTAMALGVWRVLNRCGEIDQDELAAEFAAEYHRDPHREYGASMHDVLSAIHDGEPWRVVAGRQFDGLGSWGNGAAMRVAPLGAWFPLAEVPTQAVKSAEVTHAHPEALAGAVAVAVATALSVQGVAGADLLGEVIAWVPDSQVKAGLERAQRIRLDTDSRNAGGTLGNGSRISAVDTVPFAVWCAAKDLDDLVAALWSTAAAGGDIDTTCAMVGGIVGARTGLSAVPDEWLAACEPVSL